MTLVQSAVLEPEQHLRQSETRRRRAEARERVEQAEGCQCHSLQPRSMAEDLAGTGR